MTGVSDLVFRIAAAGGLAALTMSRAWSRHMVDRAAAVRVALWTRVAPPTTLVKHKFDKVGEGAVGGNSRYDRDRPVNDLEAREARALHTVGELVRSRGVTGLDARLRGQVAQVLDSAAIELSAGRALPVGVRRAVAAMAGGLRAAMDPRTGPDAPTTPVAGDWRIDYNNNRPHTAHGDLTPSEFAQNWINQQPALA